MRSGRENGRNLPVRHALDFGIDIGGKRRDPGSVELAEGSQRQVRAIAVDIGAETVVDTSVVANQGHGTGAVADQHRITVLVGGGVVLRGIDVEAGGMQFRKSVAILKRCRPERIPRVDRNRRRRAVGKVLTNIGNRATGIVKLAVGCGWNGDVEGRGNKTPDDDIVTGDIDAGAEIVNRRRL